LAFNGLALLAFMAFGWLLWLYVRLVLEGVQFSYLPW